MVDFTGTYIYPGGINEYKRDVYFSINAPNGFSGLDNTNDFSFKGLDKASPQTGAKTEYIPIYDNGVKIYGMEPGEPAVTPTKTVTPTPTPKETPTPVDFVKGDLNGDKTFNSIDCAYLKMHLLGISKLNEAQLLAADVDNSGQVDSIDYAIMKQVLLGIRKDF